MAVEEINFGLFSGMHGGDLGFLEIRRNPIGVGVDQRHDLCADRSVLTDFEGEISDKPVDRRAQDGSVEVELSRRAVGHRRGQCRGPQGADGYAPARSRAAREANDDRDFRRGA